MIAHPCTFTSLSFMKRDNIVNVVRVTEYGPQLHGNLGRQSNKVLREVRHLVLGQVLFVSVYCRKPAAASDL